VDRWQVLFQAAVTRWLDTDPVAFEVRMVAEWIEGLGHNGPPADAVQVWDDDELYLIKVPRIELWARCFIVVDERLVIIDRLYRP